jgi:hypothetical protein
MRFKLALVLAATLGMLLAGVSYAPAQAAPQRRVSTTNSVAHHHGPVTKMAQPPSWMHVVAGNLRTNTSNLSGTVVTSRQPDAAASRLPHGPSARALAGITVQASFGSSLLTLNWANVANAAYYKVGIWKGSFIGPIYGTTRVNASTYSAALSSLPLDSAGVRIVVDAFTSGGAKIAASESVVRAKTTGGTVSASNQSGSVSKIKKCAGEGLVAAVGTAIATGILAASTSWIPGVDVVTAGGFAVATAGAGAGALVACLVLE